MKQLLLILACILWTVGGTVWAQSPEGNWSDYKDGTGTGYDPETMTYSVSTAAQLASIASPAAPTTYEGYIISITNDIDLSAHYWTSIGNTSTKFKGTLRGNGHIISGIHVNGGRGFIAFADGATIENLTLSGTVVDAGVNDDAGAVVGNAANTTFSHVTVSGASVSSSASNVGAIVGLATGSSLTECSVSSPTLSGTSYVNAFVGHANSVTFSNCSFSSNQSVTLADGTDNVASIGAAAGRTTSVTLNGRTLFKDGKWNTICVPFDVYIPNSPLAGDLVEVRELNTSETRYSADGQTLYLHFDNVVTLLAGKPYIIKWDESGEDLSNPTFEGVTVREGLNDVTATDVVSFKGTYTPITFDADDKSILMVGDGNKLYYATSRSPINTHRAYFQLLGDKSFSTKLRSFMMEFEGDQSGITLPLATERASADENWYTLSGCRLDGEPTTKGLYIHKGKLRFIIEN